jgi:hypothetical protein
MTNNCPFKVGEWVVYKPSTRGRDLIIMTDLAKLVPGQRYKVARIDDDVYVVVEGFETSLPSGLYWTEFETIEQEL